MRGRSIVSIVFALSLCVFTPSAAAAAKVQSKTLKSWDLYVQETEKRIARELEDPQAFLYTTARKARNATETGGGISEALKTGNVRVEKLATLDAQGRRIEVDDGMIHHWFGAMFVPGVRLETLLGWVQNYDQHQRYFKEVRQSRLVSRDGDTFKIFLRLERTKVVTVHYNTDHTVVYRRHGAGRASSRSATTRIAQIDDAGTPSEKEQPIGDDSGYLWRLNSYWRFAEQDGGVLVECESISLSRSIPFGLGWLIGRYVESVPQESLESTLTSIRSGVTSRQ